MPALLRALDGHLGQLSGRWGRESPGPCAEHLHDRGNDEASDDDGVEQDGNGKAESELLEHTVVAEDEGSERVPLNSKRPTG